jgi:hypothetical protein
MMDMEIAQQNRIEVSDVAQSSPTVVVVGRKIAQLLGDRDLKAIAGARL